MAFILLHLCRGHQNHRWWRFPNSERPNCFLTGSSDFIFCGRQFFTPGSSMHVVQRCSPCDALIHKPSDNVAIVDSQQKKEPNPEAEGQTREKEPVSEFTSKHEKLGKIPPSAATGDVPTITKTNSAPPAPTVFTNFGSSSIGRGACPSSK